LSVGFRAGLDAAGANSSAGQTGLEATILEVFRYPSDTGPDHMISNDLQMEFGARSNYRGVNGGFLLGMFGMDETRHPPLTHRAARNNIQPHGWLRRNSPLQFPCIATLW